MCVKFSWQVPAELFYGVIDWLRLMSNEFC